VSEARCAVQQAAIPCPGLWQFPRGAGAGVGALGRRPGFPRAAYASPRALLPPRGAWLFGGRGSSGVLAAAARANAKAWEQALDEDMRALSDP
jgi:hypothetical protein